MDICFLKGGEKMKKFGYALGATLLGVPSLFAQDGGGNTSFDTTSAAGFMERASKTITDYWTAVESYVYTIVGVAVVVSLIWVGWKLFRKGTSKVG